MAFFITISANLTVVDWHYVESLLNEFHKNRPVNMEVRLKILLQP